MIFRCLLHSCVIAALGVLGSIANAQPKIQIVGGTNFDLGDISSLSTVKHTITVRNIGTDTLELSQIGASCGCTSTLMTSDQIAPGDSGFLAITFDPRRFSGKVKKLVSMVTNDTTQRDIQIFFTANIFKILEFDPEYLFLRGVKDSTLTGSLTIQNVSDTTVSVHVSAPGSNYVSVSVTKEVLRPGEEATLTASVVPTTAGTSGGDIVMTTDHPKLPSANIRYFVWAKDTNSPSSAKQK
jgi:hypothetical protein